MKLPEYLRFLIKSRGLNISDAARIARIERSTISRLVNGARLTKWETISQLADSLQLTPDEIRTLRSLYNEASMGEDAYQIRERVKELFLSLCNTDNFRGGGGGVLRTKQSVPLPAHMTRKRPTCRRTGSSRARLMCR